MTTIATQQTTIINDNGKWLTIPGFSRIGECYGCGRLVPWWQQQQGGCSVCIRKARRVAEQEAAA